MNRIAFYALALFIPLNVAGCGKSDNNSAQNTASAESTAAVNADSPFELILDEVDRAIGKRFQYMQMEEIVMASYKYGGSIDKVVEVVDPLAKKAGFSASGDKSNEALGDASKQMQEMMNVEMKAMNSKTYEHKNGSVITILKMNISVKDLDVNLLTVQMMRSNKVSEVGSQVSDLPPQTKRFYDLNDLAKSAFNDGKTDEAREYAKELLSLAPQHKGDWNYGNAIHDGNLILGRIAVLEDRIEDAKKLLLEAGKSPGSPQMNSFGPNMSLANDLLEKGEKEVVLEYFELCRKFWDMGHSKLDAWAEDVKSGNSPSFGANLIY